MHEDFGYVLPHGSSSRAFAGIEKVWFAHQNREGVVIVGEIGAFFFRRLNGHVDAKVFDDVPIEILVLVSQISLDQGRRTLLHFVLVGVVIEHLWFSISVVEKQWSGFMQATNRQAKKILG